MILFLFRSNIDYVQLKDIKCICRIQLYRFNNNMTYFFTGGQDAHYSGTVICYLLDAVPIVRHYLRISSRNQWVSRFFHLGVNIHRESVYKFQSPTPVSDESSFLDIKIQCYFLT